MIIKCNACSVSFTAVAYCQRVPVEEFDKLNDTDRALVDLINSILDSTTMSVKEKKQRLKQFQKHYPVLFKKHFANLH